ncbi:hypothetical protein C1M53_26595 [Mesorhizobium sp. Pch-S]|nr:hypothetical protein C1M53_26595 [Mesorhizobium sp. Pch-S]
MRRFPSISLSLLAVALLGAIWMDEITSSYCAFGFGGFQCNAPFIGWGSSLAVTGLVLLAACLVLALTTIWGVFCWWKSRSRG